MKKPAAAARRGGGKKKSRSGASGGGAGYQRLKEAKEEAEAKNEQLRKELEWKSMQLADEEGRHMQLPDHIARINCLEYYNNLWRPNGDLERQYVDVQNENRKLKQNIAEEVERRLKVLLNKPTGW